MSVRWLAENIENGELLGRVGRDGDRFIAEWNGIARLEVNRDGTDERFVAVPGAPERRVEKVRRGSARALVRHLSGKLSLHAGAVAIEGRGIALLGDSGAGKSTLVASMCRRSSTQFIADDVVAVDTPHAPVLVSLEENHWLAEGEAREKTPSLAARRIAAPVPLVAIVHLSFGDALASKRLVGAEAARVALPQVIRFAVDEPALQRAELDAIFELGARIPIYALVRPRDLTAIADTTTLIENLARMELT